MDVYGLAASTNLYLLIIIILNKLTQNYGNQNFLIILLSKRLAKSRPNDPAV